MIKLKKRQNILNIALHLEDVIIRVLSKHFRFLRIFLMKLQQKTNSIYDI